MGKRSNAPTMKDVAEEAGVALGTVSKVINGLPVGAEYRKRVEKAIQKLNYKVNIYAQGLRASKTYTVALVVPNTVNPFFGILTYHISRALAERGYRMLLCATDYNIRKEQASVDMAQQNQVDGIISLTYRESLSFWKDIPLVTIDRHISPNIPCITSDNFGGGQIAARRLIELGCRNLLFLSISSPLPNETFKRGDGFYSACAMSGVESAMLRVHDGISAYHALYSFLLERMVDGKPLFDGIFCNTDHLALQMIRFLHQKGVRVPEDVQVIGFDGMWDYATGDLFCSTIVQPIEKMAEVSVDTVLREDWNKAPSLMCLPVEYAPGGTTRE